MQHFDYRPRGVCPMRISFDMDGDVVHNVSFLGGCNGKGTSCSDQLAKAVRSALEQEK